MPIRDRKVFSEFCRFASAQLVSKDFDPAGPVLRQVFDSQRIQDEQAVWMTLLYVTWYHLGSAENAWSRFPEPGFVRERDVPELTTHSDRRVFRGRPANVAKHLSAAFELMGPKPWSWVERVTAEGGERGWRALRDQVEKLPFVGPWASYKWCKLMRSVFGFDITADDIGIAGASPTAGPIPGLVLLTGLPWEQCAADVSMQKELLALVQAEGVPYVGLHQLDTGLCNFNGTVTGRYYHGHDIDLQMEHMRYATARMWEARAKVIPSRYRGEAQGWFGVRPPLKQAYQKAGGLLL